MGERWLRCGGLCIEVTRAVEVEEGHATACGRRWSWGGCGGRVAVDSRARARCQRWQAGLAACANGKQGQVGSTVGCGECGKKDGRWRGISGRGLREILFAG